MPLFSRFKSKGAQPASKGKTATEYSNGYLAAPSKPTYVSNWNSKTIVPEEVEELIHVCTTEMKSRGKAMTTHLHMLRRD